MLRIIDKGINFRELNTIDADKELLNIIKKLLSRSNKYSSFTEVILDLSSIMYEQAEIKESLLIEEEQEELKYKEKTKLKRNKLLLVSTIIIIIFSVLATFI